MIYKVETNLKTISYSVYYELEGNSISLSYDGNGNYKSTDYIDVNDKKLDIFMRVNGLNGTGWSLTVTVLSDSDASYKKEMKDKKGVISKNNTCRFETKIEL